MNMQTIEYLRLIGLTECLLGVMLVALIFLVQRLNKRMDALSLMVALMIPKEQRKGILEDLAWIADEIEERRGRA